MWIAAFYVYAVIHIWNIIIRIAFIQFAYSGEQIMKITWMNHLTKHVENAWFCPFGKSTDTIAIAISNETQTIIIITALHA